MAKSRVNNNNYKSAKRENGISGNGKVDVNGKFNNKEKRTQLKEKTFIQRESLLTEMFQLPHLKNIYHLGIVISIALILNTIVHNYIYEEKLSFGLNLVIKGFFNIHVALYGWLCISIVNLLVYNSFQVWMYVYREMDSKPLIRKLWNCFCLISAVYYCWKSLKYAADFIEQNDVCIAGRFVLLMETLRLLMKTYAFLRSNVPKVILMSEYTSPPKLPTFKNYVYFLLIPTLIYRDEYPRAAKTNWKLVAAYLIEIFSSIIGIGFVFQNYFVPVCNQYMSTTYNRWDIVWTLMKNSIPSMCIMVLVFYLFLHSWLNMFAEITKFGDRQFYQDWWNSSSFDVYYRKWNMVVHDWLYLYIYKDMFDHVTPGSKNIAKLVVFLISSIFHEYILCYALGMFFPFLFMLFFGVGGFLAFIKMPERSVMQIMFLYGFALGLSITISSYLIEFCVRNNDCVLSSNHTFKMYEPRTISSYCLKED